MNDGKIKIIIKLDIEWIEMTQGGMNYRVGKGYFFFWVSEASFYVMSVRPCFQLVAVESIGWYCSFILLEWHHPRKPLETSPQIFF